MSESGPVARGSGRDPEPGQGWAWEPPAAVEFRPIGVIRTPFPDVEGMPIQPSAAEQAEGHIDLDPALVDGLAGIEGFSHLMLVWHLHRIRRSRLVVVPFLDDQPHGIFATRAPARPNPIAVSVVRLLGVDATRLRVRHLDMVDGTALLDIKPYVPQFDDRSGARIGWYHDRLDRLERTSSDDRFAAD